MRNREGFDVGLSFEKFLQQDLYEISELKVGGSIALADYYIVNVGNKNKLYHELDEIMKKII